VVLAEYTGTEQRKIAVLISAGISKRGSSRNAKDSHALYDNKASMSRRNLMRLPIVVTDLAFV
jgi:hypothetical protein